jgi:hypothetical protein
MVKKKNHGAWDFCSGTKKAAMLKKKVIAERNLKDWTKFTTQINDTAKKRQFNASRSN